MHDSTIDTSSITPEDEIGQIDEVYSMKTIVDECNDLEFDSELNWVPV